MVSPVPIPKDDPFADRRVHPRVAVALPAFLQAGMERHPVHLLDLSAGGAKLSCAVALAAGTDVTLDCGTLTLAATVRWQDGAFVGLSFDSALDPREVSALVARSKALESWRQARE